MAFGTMNPSFDPENDGYVNDIQKNYIRDYVQQAEDAIYSEDGRYAEFLDLQSLADYWWIMGNMNFLSVQACPAAGFRTEHLLHVRLPDEAVDRRLS